MLSALINIFYINIQPQNDTSERYHPGLCSYFDLYRAFMLWFNNLLLDHSLRSQSLVFCSSMQAAVFKQNAVRYPLSTQKTEIKDSNKRMNTIKHNAVKARGLK